MYRFSFPALWVVCMLLALAGINAPDTVYAELPPRPTLPATETPTATATPTPTSVAGETPVATNTPAVMPTATAMPPAANVPATSEMPPVRIRLVAGVLHNRGWSVVQWQGTDGVWHDVDGWQGTVENGFKQWRVAPRHYGQGPFRWVVWNQDRTRVVAVSNPFILPDTETTPLIVELKPPD